MDGKGNRRVWGYGGKVRYDTTCPASEGWWEADFSVVDRLGERIGDLVLIDFRKGRLHIFRDELQPSPIPRP